MRSTRPLGSMRGLALAVALAAATASASAETSALVAGGTAAEATEETAAAPQAPEPSPAPSPKPDGFTIGSFAFKVGGRVKLDVIRDFDPAGSEDSFDPRTIPLDGSEGTNSQLHARESRLFLDVRGPVEGQELKMYVETDFYGSGNALRLRHAYGQYGGLIAGQTWSTFVDENNMPNTIDFESPIAFPSLRQAQARWTSKIGTTASWSIAVEDNKSSITVPAGVPGKAEYAMPDLATRFRYDAGRTHLFAAAFLGKARFRPTDGPTDDVTLWGGNLSAKVKTFGRDTVYAQFTFGDGVGRYRSGVTAVPDLNGQLQPVSLTALMGGYEHYWTDRVSSNIVYSAVTTPDEDYFADTANKRLDYFAVNLIYWFLKDRAWTGVEYLHGGREVFSGQEASANRLQFAVRFNLP
jgi:outer membrane DcaP-like protein